MSAINHFQPIVQPFQAASWGDLLTSAVTGGLTAWGIWELSWSAASPWNSLAERPLLLAHALAGGLLAWQIMELGDVRNQRKALEQDVGPSWSSAPVSESVWNQAVQEVCQSDHSFSARELPQVIREVGHGWQEKQNLSCIIGLMMATLPLFLGLLQSLDALRLSAPGDYLKGYTDVCFPLIWTTGEALLCGGLAWLTGICWRRTINAWAESINHDLLNHLRPTSPLDPERPVAEPHDVPVNSGSENPESTETLGEPREGDRLITGGESISTSPEVSFWKNSPSDGFSITKISPEEES
jgi:hypothetical protein